jgi:predicted secreted protein
VPGQAESAPAQFAPGRIALRTTLVSVVLFGAFYLNYRFGWVTAESLDFFN